MADDAIEIEAPPPAPAASSEAQEAEAAYERFVWKNLPRNYAGQFMHGLLGMTGMRLFNAPTFLPAYLHMITGSDLMVGVGQSLQQVGAVVAPVIGATQMEHRKRVLGVSMTMGTLMRVQMLGIALAAWFLKPPILAPTVFLFLLLYGFFSGAQVVAFQVLMAKVIPIRRRGTLQAIRNTCGGAVSAALAYVAGRYLIQDNIFGNGYATTFMLAVILTSLGLTALALLLREPDPVTVRAKTTLGARIKDFPKLLREDRGYMFFMIAQTCAAASRIAAPYYILYASHVVTLSGAHLGLISLAFLGSDVLTNGIWGLVGDRFGFRRTFIGSMVLWIIATITLIYAPGLPWVLTAFFGLGAAGGGYQMSSQTMVLEFGSREDMPMRLALSQTGQATMSSIGPLIGGLIATLVGRPALLWVSTSFLVVTLALLLTVVDEPRFRRAAA